MKIASAAVAGFALLVALRAGPAASGGASTPDDASSTFDDPAARDRALASPASSAAAAVVVEGEGDRDDPRPVRGTSEGLDRAGGNAVRGGGGGGFDRRSRSLACVPRFTDIYSFQPGREIGIGPINASKTLMASSPPGSGFPFRQNWYAPLFTPDPFVICNKEYQQSFPGMVGYTFRVFSNAEEQVACATNGTDFYVLLKIYDVTKKKVVRRQKEMSAPYALYGTEYPVVGGPLSAKYGSTLLPNGVYQVSATMHLPNGTVVDATNFGADIKVISC